MKAEEKISAAKRPDSAALVWVRHTSLVDGDGDPVVIQVPRAQLPAYIAQGYKAMPAELVDSLKETPAEKPTGVKAATETKVPAPQPEPEDQPEIDELEEIEDQPETVNETETDNGEGGKVDSDQQKDGLRVSGRGRGGKG